MNNIETMKLALEALEADEQDMVADKDGHMVFRVDVAITALRQAIEQAQEQEPVVWMYQNKSTHEVRFQKHMRSFVDHGAWYEVPLYSEPLANQEKTSGSPIKQVLAQQAEPDYYGLTKDHLWMSITKDHYDRLKPEFRMACYTSPPPRQPEQDGVAMADYMALMEKYVALKAAQPKQNPVAIEWTLDGDKFCGYNNWVGDTPFGRILITWKGWKEHHDACVDEFPGEFNAYGTPDEVKAECEAEFVRRVNITLPPRQPLTDEEIDQLLPEIVSGDTFTVITYGRAVARVIEAAHGIKGEA